MNTRSLTISYLESLTQQGAGRIAIDDEARGVLRSWMIAAKKGITAPVATAVPMAAAAAAAQPTTTLTPIQQQFGAKEETTAPATSIFEAALSEDDAPAKAEEDDVFFRLPSGDAQAAWAYFENLLPRWQPLLDTTSLRDRTVLGTGNRQADIMFVGDAPGFKDEEEARPFVGAAGDKLDGMLRAMGLSRDEIYLTYLVKNRPALPRQTTNNRAPNEHEITIFSVVLESEIRLVQPKVIVALGVIAARGILKMGALPLSEYQSAPRFEPNSGIPVVVTHHPSYLLRTSDLAERRELWEEMLGVMRLVGLPISPKQAGYFLPKQ